jgi:hypothetical protein
MPKVAEKDLTVKEEFGDVSEVEALKVQLAQAKAALQIAEAKDQLSRSHPEMERYLIVTKVPDYTGKVFGIPITHGIGILDVSSLDPKLGHSLSRVLSQLGSWDGYTVKPMSGRSTEEAIREIRAEQSEHEERVQDLVNLLANADVAQKVRDALEAQRH